MAKSRKVSKGISIQKSKRKLNINKELLKMSFWELIIGQNLSEISTRYVTDSCRKYLLFFRLDVVTNYYHFCYKKKSVCNKYLLNLLQN